MQEIPVYLFLGFLESGKTKFIQETFEDERFDSGERTLLLVMEEGEEEYDSSRFAVRDFAVETLDPEELTQDTLEYLERKHRAERVVIEYNGMLELQKFFDAMPESWAIAQVMTFFDATTFLQYNANMRQLVFDKVQYADMVVFNRFRGEYSKEEYHKIIRAMTRRPGIVYEYLGGELISSGIDKTIKSRVKAQMEQNQKEYYLTEQLKAINKELGHDDIQAEILELEEKLKAKNMPEEARERALREVRKLRQMPPASSEYVVARNYVDWIIDLPWNELKKIDIDLARAREVLDGGFVC